MSCDCDHPDLYSNKIVKVRKLHRCVECCQSIAPGESAEKVDSLFDGRFSTYYTCLDCYQLVQYVRSKFPEDLCCHGELGEFLWEQGFLYTEDQIEAEAERELPNYNPERGVVRGGNCIIAPAPHVPWLTVRVGGKWRLAEDYKND